ncbi:MAG TPA: DMT family transporter [Crinalium sp.]|jgi:transporter family protein
MRDWILPTFGAFLCWGLWSFIPKITTRHIDPKSAIVYEVIGGILLATFILATFRTRPELNSTGIILAITTGVLGFTGAFFFLTAMSRGPVTLVATLSALYPMVSILLAVFFLQETITLRQGVGIFLALISVLLIAA